MHTKRERERERERERGSERERETDMESQRQRERGGGGGGGGGGVGGGADSERARASVVTAGAEVSAGDRACNERYDPSSLQFPIHRLSCQFTFSSISWPTHTKKRREETVGVGRRRLRGLETRREGGGGGGRRGGDSSDSVLESGLF